MEYFNINYYIDKYDDLNHLKLSEVYYHFFGNNFNGIGIQENRLFNENLENFNYNDYINENKHLSKLNIYQIHCYYLKEFYSSLKKYNKYLNYKNINTDFIINNHKYLKYLSNEDILYNYFKSNNYYLNKKIESDKDLYYLQIFNNINLNKFNIKNLLIYVYYERNNEQKNQTNLSFFLKHGINNFSDVNNETFIIIIINGKSEILLDNKINILIEYKNFTTDSESWNYGIQLFKNYNFYMDIEYLILINCSVFGPIYNNNNWLDPFTSKMNDEYVICAPTANYLPQEDAGGPGFRLPSTFLVLKYSDNIINLLTNTKICNLSIGTTNNTFSKEFNTILGPKKNRADWILTGEYGITRILLENNYKIATLINNNNKEYKFDRNINNENKYSIYDLIFIKNNWRINNELRDSLPVLYNECINYQNKVLNYKPIEFNEINLNYENIDINNTGTNYTNNKYNWKSKEHFYKLYGYSEEFIIFPKLITYNKCVIYNHYDKDNIIKDYIIIQLKIFLELGYYIYFCTSSSKIDNINLPFKIYYYNNLTDIYNIYDFYLENKEILKTYDYILTCNDSLIFPINGIEHFKNTINFYTKYCDFWGIWESDEKQIHLISSWIHYTNKCFFDLMNYYCQLIPNMIRSKDNAILLIEVQQTKYLVRKKYKYKSIISFRNIFNPDKECLIFHPDNKYTWLNHPDIFAIKWKYMGNYLKNYNNEILNYLMRFIKIQDNISGINNLF